MVALLVLLTVLVFLSVDYLVQRRRQVAPATEARLGMAPLVMHVPSYRTPPGVYFHPGHAWAFLEASGDALVGVDDLARTIMGRIDRIDTVPTGTEVRTGDKLMELFHRDRSVVIESPFDGVVDGSNEHVGEAEENAPLTSEWLCRIKPQDTSLLQETMLLGSKAGQWLRREARRLRVFLSTIAPQHPVLAQTMHDGGMPYAGLVEYLEEEDWNKLREAFFDHREGLAS
jgi:glycine cleavage system H lipoate-binding protein